MCTTPIMLLSGNYGFEGPELHSLLPCTEHMALHVTWHYAPEIIRLHSLWCVQMKKHAPLASTEAGRQCHLTVPSSCSLSQLRVIGPKDHISRICIAVWKGGLGLNCVNVSNVALCHESVLTGADRLTWLCQLTNLQAQVYLESARGHVLGRSFLLVIET